MAQKNDLLIDLPKSRYKPSETIEGEILWSLEKEVDEIQLKLGWWTEGRGSMDAYEADCKTWKDPERSGRKRFQFTLPDSPYSFSGTLITLQWALELSASSIDQTEVFILSVTPGETDITLEHIHESRIKSISFLGNRKNTL